MKFRVIIGICGVLSAILVISCQDEQSIDFKRYYAEGSVVYQTHCQNCHSTKGEGLAALIPPLTHVADLKKSKTSLPCIVQFGLQGKITVGGKQFEGNMPPADLTPIEVAQVVIYVSNSFGNQHGFMSEDEVDKALGSCR